MLYRLIEIEKTTDDDFRKVMETLTRIGKQYKTKNKEDGTVVTKLKQICYIIKKKNRIFIAHYKQILGNAMVVDDYVLRDKIVTYLEQWKLIKIITPLKEENKTKTSYFTVIPYVKKHEIVLFSVIRSDDVRNFIENISL